MLITYLNLTIDRIIFRTIISRYAPETRLESVCRVLEVPPPRCSRIKQFTQQEHVEKADETGNASNVEQCVGNPSTEIITCEHGLVKGFTLTTGTFKDGAVQLKIPTTE